MPQTIKGAQKHINGVPNLSWFKFDDITKCSTYIKANLKKNSPSTKSLTELVTCPYQGLFIDFGFSGGSYD